MRVAVLGAGSWGTTVAHLCAHNTETTIWSRDPEIAAAIETRHVNPRYLDGYGLHPGLRASTDLASVVGDADLLVMGVPSAAFREIASAARAHLRPWVPPGLHPRCVRPPRNRPQLRPPPPLPPPPRNRRKTPPQQPRDDARCSPASICKRAVKCRRKAHCSAFGCLTAPPSHLSPRRMVDRTASRPSCTCTAGVNAAAAGIGGSNGENFFFTIACFTVNAWRCSSNVSSYISPGHSRSAAAFPLGTTLHIPSEIFLLRS